MLICPQCKFENPNTNKFCQSCGTSLTHKVCPECGTNVAVSEKQCQNCGSVTGTIWWAIISYTPQTYPIPQFGAYLDSQQRYQLLEPLPPLQEIAPNAELQAKVLDCQPFQLSPLQASAASGITMDIPALAKAYVALSQPNQSIPAIHDAWQQESIQVVLLEDRSEWQQLIELWKDDKTTRDQILLFLYEIAQVWAALEPWHCRQSLLELSNLRVGKDQLLKLQRLYAESATEPPLTLQDLGQVWQRLFQESQRTQFGSLVQLLQELKAGSIQTIDDLRSRLETVANQVQENIPAPEPILPLETAPLPATVVPMQLVSCEDAGRTDVGRQRDHNEDYFGIQTAINKVTSPNGQNVQVRGLYILCDGMGGHAKGEVASTLAVETLQQYFQSHWQHQLPTEDTIREAVRLANQAIYDMNQQDARSGIGRMGTTLVLVLVQDTQIAVAHVGDSRLYQLSRQRGLEQVTLDHEVGQRDILRGVEPELAYARPDAYQLTQALGPRDENFIIPEVKFLDLNEDTLLILVSDGLSDNDLLEQHWRTHLEPLLSSGANLERGVTDLIDLANQYNGHDNITAIVIRAQVMSGGAEENR